MIIGGSIIRAAMDKRGFKHRRTDDQLSIRGEYTHHLQYVYSKEYQTKDGTIIDLIYFCADMLKEKLIIGLYRENKRIENGTYLNEYQSFNLCKFNAKTLEKKLNKLILPVHRIIRTRTHHDT